MKLSRERVFPMWHRVYGVVVAVAVVILLGVYGCGDSPQTGSDEPDREEVEITWQPQDGFNGIVNEFEIEGRGGVGFEELHVSSEQWDTTITIAGTQFEKVIQREYDFDEELPVEVDYIVKTTETDGTETTKPFTVNILDGSQSSISWSPKDAFINETYNPTLSVKAARPLQEVKVTGEGFEESFTPEGTSFSRELEFNYDFSRTQLPNELTYTVLSVNVDQDSTLKEVPVMVDYINNPPSISVDLVDEITETNQREQEISFTASDDFGLDQVIFNIEDEQYVFHLSGTEQTKSFSHTFTSNGSAAWSAEVTDDEGLTYTADGEILIPLYRLEVQARGFLHKEPNTQAGIWLEEIDSGQEFHLQVNHDGKLIAEDLKGSVYRLKMSGGINELNRMRVDMSTHPDTHMYWHGEDYTYIASGLENTPALFKIQDNVTTYMETVEPLINPHTGGELLDELSRFLSGVAGWPIAVPNPTQTQTIVYNLGNSAYPDDFNIWDYVGGGQATPPEDWPDGGANPPGSMFNEQQIQNFDQYIDDIMAIFNSPIVGQNPYEIVVVKDYAENLHDYFFTAPHPTRGVDPKDNVMYIANTNGSGLEGGGPTIRGSPGDRKNPWHIPHSYMFVTGSHPAWYSNESRHFGTFLEPNPGICSVKDDEDIPIPDQPCFPTFPGDGSTFKDIDIKAWKIFTAFGPYAMIQHAPDYVNSITSVDEVDWVPTDSRGFDFAFNNEHRAYNVYLKEPSQD